MSDGAAALILASRTAAEANEAFAVVPVIFVHKLGVPSDKLNVNGGACALGQAPDT
ncbi:MAG: hypothetical protein ABJQ70_10450 [Roseobacter sp.]